MKPIGDGPCRRNIMEMRFPFHHIVTSLATDKFLGLTRLLPKPIVPGPLAVFLTFDHDTFLAALT